MSDDTPRNQMSTRRVVYTLPGMDSVAVRRDQPYRVTANGSLTMDVYYPPALGADNPVGCVILVTGFSDLGAQRMLGAKFKDLGAFVSWAQLMANSGMAAITYENREPADVHELLAYVRRNAATLGIDERRIGLWACSGHGPNALSVLMTTGGQGLAAAALVYPYTLDLDGSMEVADAARQFRFVTVPSGKSIAELPRNLPLFVARAGRDAMPGLNTALDRFIGAALAANHPLAVMNHAGGDHAFDLVDDSKAAQDVIRHLLTFLQFQLSR